MAYDNWDDVRDNRLYSYLNKKEMDNFLEAMRLKDIGKTSNAARTFINERSHQIIIEHRRDKYRQPNQAIPTVKLPCFYGENTITKLLN